jgi:hypothetical protein
MEAEADDLGGYTPELGNRGLAVRGATPPVAWSASGYHGKLYDGTWIIATQDVASHCAA